MDTYLNKKEKKMGKKEEKKWGQEGDDLLWLGAIYSLWQGGEHCCPCLEYQITCNSLTM